MENGCDLPSVKKQVIYGSAEYHGDNLMVSCSTTDSEPCGCMVKG